MRRKTFAAALGLGALMAQAGAAQTGEGTLTAAGNEPFWRADVTGPDFIFRGVAFPDLVLSVVERTSTDEDTLVIRAASSSPAQSAVLTFSAGPCADTMADQTYPFTAELALDDTFLTGCAGDPRLLLIGVGTWQVETLAGADLVLETEVTLAFVGGDVVSGGMGCNRFSGLSEITGEGLSISALATTRMACPEPVMTQERQVLDLLGQVVSFDIRDDGGLTLVTGDGDRIETRAP